MELGSSFHAKPRQFSPEMRNNQVVPVEDLGVGLPAPTNQVIPREAVEQWEREAQASMPKQVVEFCKFDSRSWGEFVAEFW